MLQESHKRRQKNQAHKQLFRYQCQHSRFSRTRLVKEKDKMLYADSACRSKQIEKHLKEIKCTSKVHEKCYRNKPLLKLKKSDIRLSFQKINLRESLKIGF